MDNDDIYDLLEIDRPDTNVVAEATSLKQTSAVKHSMIRIGILLAVLLIIGIMGSNSTGYDILIPLFFGAVAFVVWIFFICIEASILYRRKKTAKGKANLISLAIMVVLLAIVIALAS